MNGFQNALHISEIAAVFSETWDAVKNRLQIKYCSFDTINVCFNLSHIVHQWFLSITAYAFSLADLPLQCSMPSHI